jgi:alpha-D-xyloside xylohydrolase
MALLPTPPPSESAVSSSPTSVTVGDLVATIATGTGWLTFSRASTGAALLSQSADAAFSAPPPHYTTRAGSVAVTLPFAPLQPGERLYGLGEHPATGAVGFSTFESVWGAENNGVLTIPWAVSSEGWGFLWNTPAYGNVSLDAARGWTWAADATLNADFWVTASDAAPPPRPPPPPPRPGPSTPFTAVMARYVDAVGHAPPMPYAASGFWQSKNRYRNQTQLLAVAAGFASRGLPLAVIVIDYLSWPLLGDDFLTPACWPDPAGMVATLTAQGVQTLVSMYPYQNVGSVHYAQFVDGNLSARDATGAVNGYNGCLGGQTLLDAFSPAARNATFDAWTEGYGKYGVSWMWQDCSEPGRDASLNGRWLFTAGSDAEVGPAWTREYARIMADGNAAAGLNASSFVTLSRAAYPGSWAHSAALWSGDINTTFASMAQQVRVVQSACASGVALWASDTGGYLGNGNASDPVWVELLQRWTWFSALTPIMRFHGKRVGGGPTTACGDTHGDNEPWAFGDAAYAAIAAAIHFREGLRPYVMAANAATAATGAPMVQPLALAFPDDPAAALPASEAAYLFGPSMLVQPVTEYGATNASVYLTIVGPGAAWAYHFNASLRWCRGGVNVTVPAPLDEIPLFDWVADAAC